MLRLWYFFLHHLLNELWNLNKLALFIHSFSLMPKNSTLLNLFQPCWLSGRDFTEFYLYWLSGFLYWVSATLLAPTIATKTGRYLKGWWVDTLHSNAQASSSHTFLARNNCCCCRCHSCFSLTRDGILECTQLSSTSWVNGENCIHGC